MIEKGISLKYAILRFEKLMHIHSNVVPKHKHSILVDQLANIPMGAA